MDPQRERVEADLRGLLQGEVRCDDIFVQMYASDASVYEIRPLGVVRPRHTADVVACVEYAAENNLPIHARGAGTGLAGESLGHGIVIDFSHSMRRIIRVDDDRIRVQPGVVLGNLNRQLAAQGRCFGPDPANQAVTTMGSVLAVDGSGSRWPLYGSARDQIERVKIVTSQGKVLDLSQHTVSSIETTNVGKIASSVKNLIDQNEALIRERYPRTMVNRSGYRLDDVLDGDSVNLAKLMAGSEGTLGLITGADIQDKSHSAPGRRRAASF